MVHEKIGKCIARNIKMVEEMGWEVFVEARQVHGDFASLGGVHHPVCCLVFQYKHRRASVALDIKYGQRYSELPHSQGFRTSLQTSTPLSFVVNSLTL